MRILITNDDGINAEGILALAYELQKEHDITVVAPSNQKSACGHSITIYEPIVVKKVDIEGIKGDCYSVDGTPADCVKIGTNKFVNDKVDLVVSGINNGFNLGTDVLYSGTVSAAIEAAIYKIPSIAVSMDRDKGKIKYDVAAKFISQLIKNIDVSSLGRDVVLNVNVPNMNYKDILGYKICNLGTRIYSNCFIEKTNDMGDVTYEIQGEIIGDVVENTDVYYISKGYITITPLHYDLTNFKLLNDVDKKLKDVIKIEGQ